MPKESKAQLKKRFDKILAILKKTYPGARTALNYSNPLELLVATILSAQTTDKGVNLVTEKLFRKYRTAADYAGANVETFQQEIKPTGFYRNKAKSVMAMAKLLVDQHGGRVPETMEELVALPGVARKTANVVLGNAFGKNEGICVDRHVARVGARLKLTAGDDPVQIEQDLMKLAPQHDWTLFSHMLIDHGRAICTARSPNCAGCPLNKLCPSAFKV